MAQDKSMLTPVERHEYPGTKRAANRQAIAAMLKDLAEREGASATIEPYPCDPKALCVRIAADGAYVSIKIDASGSYLTPWNVTFKSDRRFSPAFGAVVGASVNPYHRQKCMGFAASTRTLVADIGKALVCIASGEAYLPEG